MTKESFRDQPGQLSLTLRCASSISTQNQDAHTIETHHQKDIEHFSYGSLFYSGTQIQSLEYETEKHRGTLGVFVTQKFA